MDTFTTSMKVITAVFNWRVILDILLIAAGLFFLYRTLLRLGTWKIVAGILVALLIFATANILDLKGIEWIYTNVSHVAVIALIVIFQPELRKLFERAASLRKKQMGKGGTDLAFIMCEAIFALAKQRRGAILVLPGKEPLEGWFSGGIPLKAVPTFPIIMSIFDPNSPGHDGALIVDSGKLTRFGVRLPISTSENLSEEFGTRHHAAMGLSEVSDALVLVVSEERGSVTLFSQGRAERVYEKEKVIPIIRSHWEKTATAFAIEMHKGKKRWDLISQMGISLVLAVVFWTTVIFALGEIREKVLSVPVEYIATPKHLALVGDRPSEIKLHLTGPKSDLDESDTAELAVKIDLSKAVPGKQSFVLTDQNVELPRGVKLLDVVPSSLTLSLVEIIQQDVPVKPQLVGRLPSERKLRSVDVIPRSVRVFSPAGEGKGEEVVLMTTPIYLENIKESTVIFGKIIAPPSVQPAEKRWPDVEVYLTVVPP